MLNGQNFVAGEYGPREQWRAAVEFYTQVKTSYIHAGAAE